MSLYKTARCRHFDEAGNPIQPYCSQGNKCRFIHPNDYQWAKLKRRNDSTPSPQSRQLARSKGKHKPQFSPDSPPHRQRSPLRTPQMDSFKRKEKDAPREPENRDWPPVQNGDRRRESDSWLYTRERGDPLDKGYASKRPNDESEPYPNQRLRLSGRTTYGPTSGDNTHPSPQKNEIACPVSRVPARDPGAKSKVSETFHRLAKLCCEIVQDTCFLDREEDKLKAFTGLSSQLSRAVPGAAMAVTPALATVITGHTRTRERVEHHVSELEALWKALFSTLEDDISKAIDSRLEQAMTLLDKDRANVIQAIMRSQKPVSERLSEGTTGPRQRTDTSTREAASDRTAFLSEGGTLSLNSKPAKDGSAEEARHHVGPTSLSLVPTQEADLGTSLRIVLEDMKMQMDRQTRAIELLAKENQTLQLKSTTEFVPPQFVPSDSTSPSPRKPSYL
ncbi:hypothetical protein JVU11DRAFT_553 [Chiua virens]|nr:hypothetical protein JVU11DRAFT_553 [Chiua virens]